MVKRFVGSKNYKISFETFKAKRLILSQRHNFFISSLTVRSKLIKSSYIASECTPKILHLHCMQHKIISNTGLKLMGTYGSHQCPVLYWNQSSGYCSFVPFCFVNKTLMTERKIFQGKYSLWRMCGRDCS